MLSYSKESFQSLPKIPRLNLINSCTGYKSANLIATKTIEGISNVAVFSSVTHLGSDPAILGFILRPTIVPRNTYKNIKDLGYFTVNHITESMIIDAHHSSANYDDTISEFDKTALEEDYQEGISIPFVKGSPVQMLCKYLNEYEIKENGTIHIIASIEHLFIKENLIQNDHWLRLDLENVITINGLDGYCVPKLVERFEYARPNIPTKSML
jgi:flavin reductase (DIM6/NTAB) family NADH-FMN oxidoreductase RutF